MNGQFETPEHVLDLLDSVDFLERGEVLDRSHANSMRVRLLAMATRKQIDIDEIEKVRTERESSFKSMIPNFRTKLGIQRMIDALADLEVAGFHDVGRETAILERAEEHMTGEMLVHMRNDYRAALKEWGLSREKDPFDPLELQQKNQREMRNLEREMKAKKGVA